MLLDQMSPIQSHFSCTPVYKLKILESVVTVERFVCRQKELSVFLHLQRADTSKTFCFHSAVILLFLSKNWSASDKMEVTQGLVCFPLKQSCVFCYCVYVVWVLCFFGKSICCVCMSVYLHYLCPQILKHTHTKRPQDSLYRQPQPAKSRFFLVSITKQKTTHISIYQINLVNYFERDIIYITIRDY